MLAGLSFSSQKATNEEQTKKDKKESKDAKTKEKKDKKDKKDKKEKKEKSEKKDKKDRKEKKDEKGHVKPSLSRSRSSGSGKSLSPIAERAPAPSAEVAKDGDPQVCAELAPWALRCRHGLLKKKQKKKHEKRGFSEFIF